MYDFNKKGFKRFKCYLIVVYEKKLKDTKYAYSIRLIEKSTNQTIKEFNRLKMNSDIYLKIFKNLNHTFNEIDYNYKIYEME